MQVGHYYYHFCSNCNERTEQRFEGLICSALDEFHCAIFPQYRQAYGMTCLHCKSTRTYGIQTT